MKYRSRTNINNRQSTGHAKMYVQNKVNVPLTVIENKNFAKWLDCEI